MDNKYSMLVSSDTVGSDFFLLLISTVTINTWDHSSNYY